MAYPGSNVTFTIGGVNYVYNLQTSNGTSGLWAVQNVTPTFVQAKAGSAIDNEVQPFAEIAYDDWTGSIGLYERSRDPGDFTRPFFSTLDTSRAGQLTGISKAKAGANPTISAPGIDVAGTIFAWVDAIAGPGFIAKQNGSANYGYWRWNPATFNWDLINTFSSSPIFGTAGTSTPRVTTGSMHAPFQTVTQYGQSLWMGTGGGPVDATGTNTATGLYQTNNVALIKFFDQLVCISSNGGILTIQPYNGNNLSNTQAILADGTSTTLQNNITRIWGESVLMGAVAWNGVLWIFTDRSLYTAQWIEATNTFVFEPQIVGTAKFTSNPVVYQNELWIGSDNQLWHLAAHQTNNDFKPIDPDGWLPSPFHGRITELHPFMQTLVAKVVNTAGATGANDCVLLRYSSLGSWQFLADISNFTPSGVVVPALHVQDGTNFSAMHVFTGATTMNAYAVYESGQNSRNISGGATTYAGIHITPWEYGNNRTAQKQLLRARWEVDHAASGAINGYYQTDTNNAGANSPSFSAYVGGSALGTWATATPTIGANTAGDAGSLLDSTGTGVTWTEYDGTNGADWHGSTAYPTFKRIRWLYNLAASPSGTPQALLSHAWHRLEYAFKFYAINTTLIIERNQDDPTNPNLYNTTDAVVAAVNLLQQADYNKSIITVTGPDNTSYKCVISKFTSNYTIFDPDGPRRAVVQLTLQSTKLFGLAV